MPIYMFCMLHPLEVVLGTWKEDDYYFHLDTQYVAMLYVFLGGLSLHLNHLIL